MPSVITDLARAHQTAYCIFLIGQRKMSVCFLFSCPVCNWLAVAEEQGSFQRLAGVSGLAMSTQIMAFATNLVFKYSRHPWLICALPGL